MLNLFSKIALTYATTSKVSASGSNSALILIVLAVLLVVGILAVAGMWRTFQKAGRPGWAAIVPFYNYYVLFEIGGKPGWLGIIVILLAFIPFIGSLVVLALLIIVNLEVAKRFNRSTLFAVLGLTLFSFVGYAMLGFGHDEYHDPTLAQPSGDSPVGGSTLWNQATAESPMPNGPIITPTVPVEPVQPEVAPLAVPQIITPTAQESTVVPAPVLDMPPEVVVSPAVPPVTVEAPSVQSDVVPAEQPESVVATPIPGATIPPSTSPEPVPEHPQPPIDPTNAGQ
jgi:hypothetical protein